jgi:hypothetical protein
MPKNKPTTKSTKEKAKPKTAKSIVSPEQNATKKKLFKKRQQSRQERKAEANQSRKKLTGSFRLFADSFSLLRQHWKLFGGIILIYFILSFVLIGTRGSGFDLGAIKEQVNDSSSGVGANLALFTLVASSSSSTSSESGASYQSIVVLIVSLATIWALRQIMARKKIKIRDTFYKGMYPMIPVVLVLLVIGLQFIPLILSVFLLGVGFGSEVAVGFVEKTLWGVVIGLLALLSLYMVCSSTFAFYVATLPDMRPMAALRSARQLVRFRRWTVMRRLLFLPFALLVVGALITLPFIWVWPVAAQWVFLLLSMIGLIFAHIYLYSLYRELL